MNTNAKSKPAAPAARKPLIFIPPEKRCGHRTQRGTPCCAARWRASRFCIFHDPNFRKVRKHLAERRESAGKQTTTRTAEGIHQMLENAVQDVREKRISSAEASSIGYLGQVMISNLKNLPPALDLNTPSRDYIDSLTNNWAELLNDKVNQEIARWLPESSPFAVALAERDVVKIAADASAAEARAAASKSPPQADPAPQPAQPYTPPPIAWKRKPYDP
jgi:hypothetical protein